MSRILGGLELGIGIVFLVFSLWTLSGVPGAIERLSQEPEDLYGLIFTFILCLSVGGVAAATGLIILRKKPLWQFSSKKIAVLNVLGVLLLSALALVGLLFNDPGSKELVLLFIPAVIMATSYSFIKRFTKSEGTEN